MKSKLLFFFSNKRPFFVATLVGALTLSGLYLKNFSSQKIQLANLSEGVQTCFLRINQSYTAKLLAQNNGDYLGNNFFTTSEECFAEAITTVKNQFKGEAKTLFKNLNALSSEVHTFHEKLRTSEGNTEILATTFVSIENLKVETQDSVVTLQEDIQNDLNLTRYLFYLFSGLFPLLLLWEYLGKKREEKRLEMLEQEATTLLEEGDTREDLRVETLLKRALTSEQLSQCSRLFEVWNKTRQLPQNKLPQELTAPMKVKPPQQEIFEEIKNDFDRPVLGTHLKEVEVELLLAKVVDSLSGKIFTSGIRLDLDVASDLCALGREESLEQLLYHTTLHSLNSLSETSGLRRLCISAKAFGNHIDLEFFNNGEFLAEDSLEVTLCHELIKEVGGQFLFENIMKEKKKSGTKIKIRLNSSLVDPKRLVSLKKGKKKDLMRELSSSSSSSSTL